MKRLTPEQIETKRGIGLIVPEGCRLVLSSEIESLFDTIEAQQQEIDQLKAQAGRVMRMEEGLKGQRSFLQLLNNLGGLGYEKHGWISDHIKAIDALLGGKEDV